MLQCPICQTPIIPDEREDPHYECCVCHNYVNLILLGAFQKPEKEEKDELQRLREAGM